MRSTPLQGASLSLSKLLPPRFFYEIFTDLVSGILLLETLMRDNEGDGECGCSEVTRGLGDFWDFDYCE